MAYEITLMPPQIIVSDTPEAVAAKVAADFADLVEKTLAGQERFSVALPGGQTPKLFFDLMSKEPYRSRIAWPKIWVFFGDERSVPPEHQESNFGVARDLLLQKVPISSAHVYRIYGEQPASDAARIYEKALKGFFKTETEPPAFDLILLGLGLDGHTASLIPGTSALQEEQRWVVENVVRSLQTVRITFTYPVINHAHQVWFMVTGAKKATAFAKAQAGPSLDTPASLVQPDPGELRWYVDKAVVEPPPPK
jgi:6-phosphogluconolactonase